MIGRLGPCGEPQRGCPVRLLVHHVSLVYVNDDLGCWRTSPGVAHLEWSTHQRSDSDASNPKTHLLKAIYGLALAGLPVSADRSAKEVAADISGKLLRLFSPEESKISALRARGAKALTRLSLVSSDETRVAISFGSRSQAVQIKVDAGGTGHELQPVFIPTKEVLSLVRGMRHPDHDRATVEMIFDDGYIDLAELLVRPGFEDEASSLNEDPRLSSVVHELVDLVDGRYRWTPMSSRDTP